MALSEHPISVTFPSRTEAVRASRSEGANLELFIPTHQRLPLGRQLKITVSFADAEEVFELSGRVGFIRAGNNNAEPGLGVTFEGPSKQAALDMLAFCTGSKPPEDRAAGKRTYAKLRCRVHVGNNKYDGEVVDLSSTGVFVSAPKIPRLKAGGRVSIQFKAGLLSWGPPLDIRISWQGDKRGQNGFGGRFVGSPGEVAREIAKYLRPAP